MKNMSGGLIESTLHNLREHLHNLEGDRTKIDQKITEVKTTIERWEAELRYEGQPDELPQGSPPARRKKGENLRILRELYKSDPGLALTIQEVVERTSLAHSSVQVVFMKAGSGWEKDADNNRWRLVRSEKRPAIDVTAGR